MDTIMELDTGMTGGTTTIIEDHITVHIVEDVKLQSLRNTGYQDNTLVGHGFQDIMSIVMWLSGRDADLDHFDILFDFLNKRNPRKNRGYLFVCRVF